ncbi:DUF4037 domain-containing protein [Fictibacillus barbaricus]|uniref:DUF4037 domain-containing protein n=1 Tax=Fictibacillus barbaricus TaxID=182136 RepID=A0ABU1TVY1_9BACL|nr:DUF4037 domain-containing protein [Fictibacillus barbaricus]MDR7071368.1 hypothetical protein [Fictibacillus barbaricus]
MKLIDIAIHMATLYQKNPKVKAVLLAGSVSRGWEDKHSDIELNLFWSEAPTDDDRMNPIEAINGSIIDFHAYEEEEWAESYLTEENVKLEISSFLIGTAEIWIDDVVKKYEIDYGKQCMVSSIYYGQSLFGDSIIKDLKKKIEQYPDKLAENMIEENLALWQRWNNRNALLDRKDWLMLYDLMGSVQKKLMGTLFGLNNLFIHHPSFKWMHACIELFKIKPKNLDERFTKILIGDPNESIGELEQLVEEVFVLVEQQYPHLPFLDTYKEKLQFVRPQQEVE